MPVVATFFGFANYLLTQLKVIQAVLFEMWYVADITKSVKKAFAD